MRGRSIIGRRLKEARLKAGLSQKKLGIAAGIDEFTASSRLNHYEQGTHAPRYQALEQFGRVLNVPSAYFVAREDDLAEVIELYGRLSPTAKRRFLTALRKTRIR